MADDGLASRAKTLLDRLSQTPRFAGSAEESRARALCRHELETAGFVCREIEFEFSDWPARWGPPFAALVQLAILVLGIQLAKGGQPVAAAIVIIIAAVVLGAIGAAIRRYGVLSFPSGRARSVNLEAARGSPRVWLVSHLDSKSQTVPMLVRIASSVAMQLVSIAIVAAVVIAATGLVMPARGWFSLQILAAIAAVPTIFCVVRNRSPGAVDNATGVVAAILAATRADAPCDLGVLVTSGEELGLAGARAWARSAPRGIRVLNCDTVDDAGGWHAMYSGAEPAGITSLARAVGAARGLPMRIDRLIPGILADNIAFSDAGIEAVTVSRGNFSTLARIHTWRDTSIALTGQGAAEAGAFLSALAKELG
jgi:hypothetical protein